MEQCLVHGFKKPGVSLSSTPLSMVLLTTLAKHDEIAADTLKRAGFRKENSVAKSRSLIGHTPRYNWIRLALIEKTIVDIVKSVTQQCTKLYHDDSLIRNPVTGNLFLDLLSGLIALDYTKTKTPDHFWSDPPASELLERQMAKGDQPRHLKHPNSSLTVCTPSALHFVTENDPSACHTRSLVASLYQNTNSVLLFGKNNVTVQKPEGDYQTGYLALHQSGKTFFMKWMSNRFVDHHRDPTFYWDYSWVVYLEEVAYIHAHPYEKEGSVVFIGHDGVQRPPVLFPTQTSLVDFLTNLETGLVSEGFSMEPTLGVYLTPMGTFPQRSDKKRHAVKQTSFFVFQVNAQPVLSPEDARADAKRKRDSIGSTQSINSDQIKGKKTKEDGSEETISINSSEIEEFHLPTRIGEVCQTMRYQILSRAFYGWLAYCRHLSEVRRHLSSMVYPAKQVEYPHLESGITREVWASLHNEEGIVTDGQQLMFYTYHGGVEAELRPEVWRYLLGHHCIGDTPDIRKEKDSSAETEYNKIVVVWTKVESYIYSNSKSKFTPLSDQARVSPTEEGEEVREEEGNGDANSVEEGEDHVDHHLAEPITRSGLTSPASEAYLTPVQEQSVEYQELEDQTSDPLPTNGPISPPIAVTIDGVEYTDEMIALVDLNFHRIDKDVQRCDRNYYFFTDDNLARLRRIMCSYVWENLEIGYLQGMCDILAPLLVILDDEPLAFTCFRNLMGRMTMNFPHGGQMDAHFANMRSLIQILDSELFEHMHQNGDYSHFYFSYRWFLLDFKRELEYEDVFRVWEGIWAAYQTTSDHFTHFIALALVEHYRDIILDNNMDFTDIIKFFNEMAERHDGKKILSSARQLLTKLEMFHKLSPCTTNHTLFLSQHNSFSLSIITGRGTTPHFLTSPPRSPPQQGLSGVTESGRGFRSGVGRPRRFGYNYGYPRIPAAVLTGGFRRGGQSVRTGNNPTLHGPDANHPTPDQYIATIVTSCLDSGMAFQVTPFIFGDVGVVERGSSKANSIDIKSILETSSPGFKVPVNFGDNLWRVETFNDLTLQTAGEDTVGANSYIMSQNSPVIMEMVGELGMKEIPVTEFSKEGVSGFVQSCYVGSTDGRITKGIFRDMHKLSVAFKVEWLQKSCTKFFCKLCSRKELLDIGCARFLFEEAAFVMRETSSKKLLCALNCGLKHVNKGAELRSNLLLEFLNQDELHSVYTEMCIALSGSQLKTLYMEMMKKIESTELSKEPYKLTENDKCFFEVKLLAKLFKHHEKTYKEIMTSLDNRLCDEDKVFLFGRLSRVSLCDVSVTPHRPGVRADRQGICQLLLLDSGMAFQVTPFIFGDVGVVERGSSKANSIDIKSILETSSPGFKVPVNFGDNLWRVETFNDLTLQTAGEDTVGANSYIMSQNSPVIMEMVGEMGMKEIPVTEFSKEGVSGFVQSCYAGSTDGRITKGIFRDMHKLSVAFKVEWLQKSCTKFFCKLCSRRELLDIGCARFLFEEAAFVMRETNSKKLLCALNCGLKHAMKGTELRSNLLLEFLNQDESHSVYTEMCIALSGFQLRTLYVELLKKIESTELSREPYKLTENDKCFFEVKLLAKLFKHHEETYKEIMTSLDNRLCDEDKVFLFGRLSRVSLCDKMNLKSIASFLFQRVPILLFMCYTMMRWRNILGTAVGVLFLYSLMKNLAAVMTDNKLIKRSIILLMFFDLWSALFTFSDFFCIDLDYPRAALNGLMRLGRACPSTTMKEEMINEHASVLVYTPEKTTSRKCVMYIHGGGFCFLSAKGFNASISWMAHYLEVVVVSVEYRLAPEHPFPAALTDCYNALQWIYSNANSLGVADEQVFIAGDSAGGNLTAAVCLLHRDRQGKALDNETAVTHPLPAGQILLYPALQCYKTNVGTMVSNGCYFPGNSAVFRKFGSYYATGQDKLSNIMGNRDIMDKVPKFWAVTQNILVEEEEMMQDEGSLKKIELVKDLANYYFMPLHSRDLKGVPPAYVTVATADPLMDHGVWWVQYMEHFGLDAKLSVVTQCHGFMGNYDVNQVARAELMKIKDLPFLSLVVMATVIPDIMGHNKVGIASKSGAMEFIIPLDQRKVNIKTEDGLQTEYISVLDVRFKSEINFLSYNPFPIHEPTGSVILTEWRKEVQIMCFDLEQVLRMSHEKFWVQMIHDETVHTFLSTFLQKAPRCWDIWQIPESFKGLHNRLTRLVFLTLLRMATDKESKEDFLEESSFGFTIYENFMFDVPKLMDICSLYGEPYGGNGALVIRMVRNIFTKQPNYVQDLRMVACQILEEVVPNITSKYDSCQTTIGLYDLLCYYFDTCMSLVCLIETYPPTAQYLQAHELIPAIASLYAHLFQDIKTKLKRLSTPFQDLRSFKSVISRGQVASVKLIHNLLWESSYLSCLSDPTCEPEEQTQAAELYIAHLSQLLGDTHLMSRYYHVCNLAKTIALIKNSGANVGADHFEYILNAIDVESGGDREVRDIDKVNIKTEDGLQTEYISVLDVRFKSEINFLSYNPFPIHEPTGSVILTEWRKEVQIMCFDLEQVLRMSHEKFWVQMIHDETVHTFLSTFLQKAPRCWDIWQIPESFKGLHNRLTRLVFLTLLRMATDKESKEDFLEESSFGFTIYENFMFDVPKLMDICSLYGEPYGGNGALVIRMVRNIFTKQPNYVQDLRMVACQILEEVVPNITSKYDSCQTTIGLYDLLCYYFDTCMSLVCLIETYPPTAQYLQAHELIPAIASLYAHLFQDIKTKLKRLSTPFQDLRSFKSVISRGQVASVKLIHNLLWESSYLSCLSDPTCKPEEQTQAAELYIAHLSQLLGDTHLMSRYYHVCNLAKTIALIKNSGANVGADHFEYILNAIDVESEGDKEVRDIDKVHYNTTTTTSSSQHPVEITTSNTADTGGGGGDRLVDKSIREIQGIFPQYGPYFLEKCLAVYHNSTEEVIAALIEENLPPHLEALRKSNPQPEQTPEQWPSLPGTAAGPPGLSNTGPPPLGLSNASPGLSNAPPGLSSSSLPGPSQPAALLNSRRNVFDGDQFDVFNNPSALDFSKIHIGKRQDDNGDTEDSAAKDYVLRNPVLNYEYDGYDDEYDDTYDGVMTAADGTGVEDAGFVIKPLNTPLPVEEEEEEGEDSPGPSGGRNRGGGRGRGGVFKPAKVDQKGQKADKDILMQRRRNEQNKSSRGNHNRRAGADKKRRAAPGECTGIATMLSVAPPPLCDSHQEGPGGQRGHHQMAPATTWSSNGTSSKRAPISILKKADSETSSTCSNSSMVRCTRNCRLRVLNTQLHSHDCFERMRQVISPGTDRNNTSSYTSNLTSYTSYSQELNDTYPTQELNDTYGRVDDLEEQLKAQREKEEILRNQIKKLKQELGISGLLEPAPGERIRVSLTRQHRTFGFKLLGRAETDSENGEDLRASSITIASLTPGSPAQKCGKILVNDYILEINGVDVTALSCTDAESVIRNSPDKMNLVLVRGSGPNFTSSTPRVEAAPEGVIRKLPESLLTPTFISDEDFDSLSAIGLQEECTLDSSQCSEVSELTELSHSVSVSPASEPVPPSNTTDSECRALAILEDSRDYEEVLLTKKDGMLGITLTYGVNELLGALFVDSIRAGSPADVAGKPHLHDQIIKINDLEIGVDILCDEAKKILSQEGDTVKFELARPKKHEVKVKRKIGQSLGMMVAVSKVEDDKSVIIGTVDPNGLVAKYGLFKGLILDKVNGVSLSGLGLKQAVEILAGCVGEISFLVYVRPNFSPYRHPRPPTPYPLTGELDVEEDGAEEEEETAERSVKFSLPPSPARSNTSASIESLPQDSSLRSSPRSGDIPIRSTPRAVPFSKSFGNPSINLINTDWSSLDRSFTSDSSLKSLRSSTTREFVRGPIRVSHQVIPTSVLPFPMSPSNMTRTSPTPYPSLNTYENLGARGNLDYENLHNNSRGGGYSDYQRPRGRTSSSPNSSRGPTPPGRSPVPPGRSPAPQPIQKPRVLGRRERAVVGADKKVSVCVCLGEKFEDQQIDILTQSHHSHYIQEVKVKRKIGQSLGMMVAVSKVEDDKSVIIGTVDPNGLVAKYGLFKGLILDKVNGVSLSGLGLKQAVEILAGCVGEISFLVYVRPNFSPYRHPRPPTPYPLTGELEVEEDGAEEEEETAERSVKFSLPPSPARSNTSASIESLPQDSSLRSSPRSGDIPIRSTPRAVPFSKSFGNPSINLINTDWSSLDRSFTSDSSLKSLRSSTTREFVRGPIRVSHQVIPTSVLPFPMSPSNMTRTSPTPHPSLNTYENLGARGNLDYENIHNNSRGGSYSDFQRPRGRTSSSPNSSRGPTPPGRSPVSPGRSPAPQTIQKPRVLGRRERAVMGADKKVVQLGTFRPINAAIDKDEHYVTGTVSWSRGFVMTPEHEALKENLIKLIEKEINPKCDQWEKDRIFPAKEVFKVLGDAGYLGISKPVEYGGMGLDISYEAVAAEAYARITSGGVGMGIGIQCDIATPALVKYGNDELKEQYLKPTISGDIVACLGVSEVGGGSDVAALKTTARRDGDEWVINGGKMWTTNGAQADWMCVLANSSEGPVHKNKSLFVLPMDTPGVNVHRKIEKMGMHASDTTETTFEDARIPANHLIGEEGKGFTYQMQQFQNERIYIGAGTIAAMDICMESTIEYTSQRQAFGRSILDNQYVHYKLAEMQTELECTRALYYKCIDDYLAGEDITAIATMLKIKTARLARQITDGCLQFWGGMGYTDDVPVSRYIGAGTIAAMDICMESTIEYTSQRQAFGRSILDNQYVHYKLAEMQTELECTRALYYKCIDDYLAGEDITAIATMLKIKTARLARQITDGCLQFWGGMGYTDDVPVSRLYRDLRLMSIGGGADEVMLSIICKFMEAAGLFVCSFIQCEFHSIYGSAPYLAGANLFLHVVIGGNI
eukprot:sb/3460283/